MSVKNQWKKQKKENKLKNSSDTWKTLVKRSNKILVLPAGRVQQALAQHRPLPADNDGQVSETPKTAAMEPSFCEWSANVSPMTDNVVWDRQPVSVSQSASQPLPG